MVHMSPLLPLHLVLPVLLLAACGETVQTEKVNGSGNTSSEANAVDAVGVAEGNKQVSPFGRPAH